MAGLKSLAQELQSKGRYGDTILAHINPQEAAMLKAYGGAGTINPYTGLPEYFSLGNVFKPVTQAWKAVTNLPVIKQVSDAVTPILQTVAPYAQYIAPFIPGVGPLMAAGLGALGSGFAGKGGFNFKRGLMGGLTAYGLGNLYAGLQAAGGTLPGASTAAGGAAPATSSAAEIANVALAEGAPTAGMVSTQPAIGSQILAGDFGGAVSQIGDKLGTMGTDFTNQMSSAGQGIQNLTGFGTQTVPLGETVTGSKAALSALGNEFGTGSATAIGMGVMGTSALDEEQKYLDQQKAAGTITDDEYNRQAAIIADGRRRAEEAMRANPYQFAEGGQVPGYAIGGVAGILEQLRGSDGAIGKLMSAIRNQGANPEQIANNNKTELANAGIRQNIIERADPTQLQNYLNAMRKGEDERMAYRSMINNPYGFANGGSIDDSYGYDTAMGSNVGNMDNGVFSPNRYAAGGLTAFNVGGQPRMLAGGGDGVSDDIPATINGNRPAKLSDGEFVVPARIVSELGNGSSRAGAKALYAMMDRVQKAREKTVGKSGVAKDSNARKYLLA